MVGNRREIVLGLVELPIGLRELLLGRGDVLHQSVALGRRVDDGLVELSALVRNSGKVMPCLVDLPADLVELFLCVGRFYLGRLRVLAGGIPLGSGVGCSLVSVGALIGDGGEILFRLVNLAADLVELLLSIGRLRLSGLRVPALEFGARFGHSERIVLLEGPASS